MHKRIQLKLTPPPREVELIAKIVRRVARISAHHISTLDTAMDLSACHLNGCELDLEALSEATEFNLLHDVFGIRQHLDRTTGKLNDSFLPRYCRPKEKQCPHTK